MAKNKKVEVSEEPQVETMVAEAPKPTPVAKKRKDTWEIKDRHYLLTNGKSPLTCRIPTSCYWFDSEKGYERRVLLTRNQNTLFEDEMQGPKQLQSVIFKNGVLTVNKRYQNMQKYLSIYSKLKNKLYREKDEQVIATYQVDNIELEINALNTAMSLDIDMAEAIMRAEVGSNVSKMSSKELKRDLLVFAKKNPGLFLELANDDNVHLRNIGIKATELGILKLSQDQRTFKWGSNDRKLMTVPFDEHPYNALASWFKTDEGMEVFRSVEKRLK